VTATTGDVLAGLEDGAREVLDANWLGGSTLPSRTLYPHQWSWDSAFMALGRSWYDEERARQELRSLFRAQWADGRVPHIVFNPSVAEDAYFPGPAFWQSSKRSSKAPRDVETSGITQPPIHARAALEMHRHTRDADGSRAFLAWLYPKLAAQGAYLDGPRTIARPLPTLSISPPERRVAGLSSFCAIRVSSATSSTRFLISASGRRRPGARSGKARLSYTLRCG